MTVWLAEKRRKGSSEAFDVDVSTGGYRDEASANAELAKWNRISELWEYRAWPYVAKEGQC